MKIAQYFAANLYNLSELKNTTNVYWLYLSEGQGFNPNTKWITPHKVQKMVRRSTMMDGCTVQCFVAVKAYFSLEN